VNCQRIGRRVPPCAAPEGQDAGAAALQYECAAWAAAVVDAEALLERAAHVLLGVGADSSADLYGHLRRMTQQQLGLKVGASEGERDGGSVRACMRVCVSAFLPACVRACVRVCVWVQNGCECVQASVVCGKRPRWTDACMPLC
jgi:hypothetical protein